MATSLTDNHSWGDLLRRYRRRTNLTQGQFIERLSLLIADIDPSERAALEQIDVFDEAAVYFSGVLDSPTLSRLEKGSRSLRSRQRCVALVWALRNLDVMAGSAEANTFLEVGGHGNLTEPESVALFGSADLVDSARPTDSVTQSNEASNVDDLPEPPTGREADNAQDSPQPTQTRSRLTTVAVVGLVAVAVALGAGWAMLGDRGGDGDGSGVASESDPAGPEVVSHVLLADELQTAAGDVGRDQTLNGLHELDNRGSSDNWEQFVKFLADDAGSYLGYRAYYLPEHIPVDAITNIRLDVNYRAPSYEAAPWVWQVERRDTSEKIRLGDNRDSLWWEAWADTGFDFPTVGESFDASIYIQDRQIWISLDGTRAEDSLDLDYEAVVVEWIEPDSTSAGG